MMVTRLGSDDQGAIFENVAANFSVHGNITTAVVRCEITSLVYEYCTDISDRLGVVT